MFRERTSFLETGTARKRELIKAWNHCVDQVPGWPPIRLILPALNPISRGPAWEAFPQGLRTDLDTYITRSRRPHRSASGKRRRACRPATLLTTKAQTVAFARKAVELGTPIETPGISPHSSHPKSLDRSSRAIGQRVTIIPVPM